MNEVVLKKKLKETEFLELHTEFFRHPNKMVIWNVSGALGSGKTTLLRNLIQHCDPSQKVKSPTFEVIKIYGFWYLNLPWEVVHVDAYRLRAEESDHIGLEDLMDQKFLYPFKNNTTELKPSRIFYIEWFQNITLSRPADYQLEIHYSDEEDSREYVLKKKINKII